MAKDYPFLEKNSDEKLRILLASLESGETREQLADRLGYQSVKSLDSFLRRRDYIWDRHQHKYVAKPSPSATSEELPLRQPERVARVLALWNAPGAEARTVAKQAGFADHREMARYMAAHRYTWSSATNTYVSTQQPNAFPDTVEETANEYAEPEAMSESSWTNYESLLEWLSNRKEMLHSLLTLSNDPKFLPRYLVPGVLVTKSIHISHLLAQLARDYSQDKRVSQREIFEVALIEFFQRHGYHDEVKQLFK
jgi:hypothetical protein